ESLLLPDSSFFNIDAAIGTWVFTLGEHACFFGKGIPFEAEPLIWVGQSGRRRRRSEEWARGHQCTLRATRGRRLREIRECGPPCTYTGRRTNPRAVRKSSRISVSIERCHPPSSGTSARACSRSQSNRAGLRRKRRQSSSRTSGSDTYRARTLSKVSP